MSSLIKPTLPFRNLTDDEYVCTLTEDSLRKAKKELNEDPKDRLNAVKALREWLEAQPHLSYKADTVQLLAFLRTAKFSQLRARKMVEGFTNAISTHRDWFYDTDTHDPRLHAVLDSGSIVPLPKKDKEGRALMLMRPGRIDLKSKAFSMPDEIRTHGVLGSYRERDENTVVNGQIFIMDFTGATMKHMLRDQNDVMKRWHKAVEGNFPGRFKGFYLYNAGTFIEVVLMFIKSILPGKYGDRIHVFDTAASLYKAVDMELLPKEYLPDDYTGPHAGTCDEIIANIKKTVMQEDFRKFMKARTTEFIAMDLSKKPTDVPQESFRKLAVD